MVERFGSDWDEEFRLKRDFKIYCFGRDNSSN